MQVEFEKQKPIQTIVEMFGGSVAHDRVDATSDDEDEDDLKGGQSLTVAKINIHFTSISPLIDSFTSYPPA